MEYYINIGQEIMQKSRISGITYLEVIVVLMIILAFTSLVTFKFSNNYATEKVNQASEILFADCFFARSLALSKNETIVLKKAGEHAYKIVNQDGSLIKEVLLPDKIAISAKDSEMVVFFKNGTTLGNTFLLNKSRSKKYVVVSLLGRIRISDNENF